MRHDSGPTSDRVTPARVRRLGLSDQLFPQFVICLILAAIVPYIGRVAFLPDPNQAEPVAQAFIGSIVAITMGTMLLRNVTTYPGVERLAYILPAFTISYGILLSVLLIFRFDYNLTVLLSGYVVSVLWFLLVNSPFRRLPGLTIGLLSFGDDALPAESTGIKWVRLESIDADVSGLNAVAVDLRRDIPDEWDRRLADFALSGLPVYHTKHLFESITGRVELEHLSETSFGTLAPSPSFMSLKALVDWIIAVIAGLLLLPFLLIVAVMIRASSPGPALFRQPRVGFKGRRFIVYKFRTMVSTPVGSDDGVEHAMTRDGDARVTSLGRTLRRTRIDELPQIINILRGEMSWIGPRPEAEVLSSWYEQQIPFYRYRHVVRPGITGWAQVNQGHVTDIESVQSKLHYDFYYIKHFSPWIDLLIIVRTLRTMATGFGSR